MKDTSGETQADDNTYNLIMKDKEMLLDIDNPLRFIFSHTALREGWDNPNVFQICTLNETKSEMKKRQEIGRGLRLAVNKDGVRLYDKNINRLTVVANEAYDDFAKALQNELKEDCGVDFGNRIKPKRNRIAVTYRKGFETDPLFLAIWEKLKTRTTYRVKYNTEELIRNAGRAIKDLPKIEKPSVHSIKNEIVITDSGVISQYKSDRIATGQPDYVIPDMLGYIQRYTELTRSTIMRILTESGRVDDLAVNPQLFMERVISTIKHELHNILINGIEYHRLDDFTYEVKQFEDWETYRDENTFEVSKKNKTIYDNFIPLDSAVENRFAKDCESSDQVEFYFKLPSWFKIPTPIGNYNPDWVVVFNDDRKICYVAETKDTGTPEVDISKLRPDEQGKLKCGMMHFSLFPDLDYQVVNSVKSLKK